MVVANDPLPNLGQVALTAALAGATAIRSVCGHRSARH